MDVMYPRQHGKVAQASKAFEKQIQEALIKSGYLGDPPVDFRLAGGEEVTQVEGLHKVLIGILRNIPDGHMRIPYDDTQKFDHEEVFIQVVTGPMGSYIEVELINKEG